MTTFLNVLDAADSCDYAGCAFRMFLLEEAASAAQLQGDDVIKLTLGISDLPLRCEIVNAITEAARDPEITRRVCPSGLPELRCALSRHYARMCDVEVPADRILVDAGSSSICRNLLHLLVEPEAEVLLPLPYYPLYKFAASLATAKCSYYRISLEDMRIDMESVKAGLTNRTCVVVLNSPGNPLGNVISRDALREFIDALPPHVYLLVDGVYDFVRFTDDPTLVPDLISSDLWRRDRLIVMDSFSKGYRMYTQRVGWCVLPAHLVRAMTIVQHHTRLTVDPSVQLGAVEALKHPEDLSFVRDTHRARWERARRRLSDIDGIRLLPTSGGFYCVLDCRSFIVERRISHCLQLAFDILERARVATVPGTDFGLPGMLRLSFTSARFDEAIDRLHSYFSERPGSKTT